MKATHTATGSVRTVISEPNGVYILTNLPIGNYTVEVAKMGFKTAIESGIVLQVDANPTLDIALKVGAVNEQITVEANAQQVETRSTGIGQVVDNVRVAEMPLNGRNPLELVLLTGMASLPGPGAINNVRNYPTIVISVAGGQGGNTAMYLLDGAIHEDPYNNLALPLPFPDALQEFKVETSALPAQYGYHSGSVVNAVTKSGTNNFHGDLFEFLRNGDLNARDFFAPTRDTLKRNQFGGVVGGHIIRDKLFFFGGYQRTTQRSDPNSLTAFVPTADMLRGDFTAVTSPACQAGKQINLNASQGFVNNQISPTLLNPVALNIAKTMPTSTNPCGRTIYGFDAGLDEDLIVTRIDYQKSEKHTIFGRYNAGHLINNSTYDGHNPLSISNYGVHDLNYVIALGDTYLIRSNVVNSFRIAASRTNVVKIRSGQYITIVPGTDRALTTAPAQTVNLVSPNSVYAANQSVNNFLNPAAFALPGLGTYGNLGQNNVAGPGMFQLNLALSRNFRIAEGKTLQIRGESFNLPNHLNPSNPVNNLSSSTFGQILSDVSGNNGLDAGDPRIIQLAMKFVF